MSWNGHYFCQSTLQRTQRSGLGKHETTVNRWERFGKHEDTEKRSFQHHGGTYGREESKHIMEAHTGERNQAHHGGTYGREESKHRITQDLQELYANICFIIFCQMTLAICNKASIAQFCSFGSRYPGIVFVKKKTLDNKRTAKSRHSHGLDHRCVMVRTNTVDVRIHSARRTKERPFSNVCKYFIKSFLVQCLSPKI